MKRFLYLSPRILGIIYILFISLFSLDIFMMESSVPPLYLVIAFLVHLIPSFILSFLLLFAWKYEKFGGIFFILLAVAFGLYFNPANIIVITAPILIGILFLLSNRSQNSKT